MSLTGEDQPTIFRAEKLNMQQVDAPAHITNPKVEVSRPHAQLAQAIRRGLTFSSLPHLSGQSEDAGISSSIHLGLLCAVL
jgi:hypothetical protein